MTLHMNNEEFSFGSGDFVAIKAGDYKNERGCILEAADSDNEAANNKFVVDGEFYDKARPSFPFISSGVAGQVTTRSRQN